MLSNKLKVVAASRSAHCSKNNHTKNTLQENWSKEKWFPIKSVDLSLSVFPPADISAKSICLPFSQTPRAVRELTGKVAIL